MTGQETLIKILEDEITTAEKRLTLLRNKLAVALVIIKTEQ